MFLGANKYLHGLIKIGNAVEAKMRILELLSKNYKLENALKDCNISLIEHAFFLKHDEEYKQAIDLWKMGLLEKALCVTLEKAGKGDTYALAFVARTNKEFSVLMSKTVENNKIIFIDEKNLDIDKDGNIKMLEK